MTGPPRFCYLILCHTDAPTALALAERIRRLSPSATVVLRHDQPDGYIGTEEATNVGADLLRSTIRIRWADWSMTKAAIEALRYAQRTTDADYYVLLSGQDTPIRDLAEWEAEIAADGADAFLGEAREIDPDIIEYRWAPSRPAPRWVPRRLDDGLAFLATRLDRHTRPHLSVYRVGRDRMWAIGVRRRRPIEGLRIVKAAQWMTMSRRAVQRIHSFTPADQRLISQFRSTRGSDETFLASLFSADPTLRVTSRTTSYARFEDGQSSPVWLTPDEIERARKTEAAFARKVPPTT